MIASEFDHYLLSIQESLSYYERGCKEIWKKYPNCVISDFETFRKHSNKFRAIDPSISINTFKFTETFSSVYEEHYSEIKLHLQAEVFVNEIPIVINSQVVGEWDEKILQFYFDDKFIDWFRSNNQTDLFRSEFKSKLFSYFVDKNIRKICSEYVNAGIENETFIESLNLEFEQTKLFV